MPNTTLFNLMSIVEGAHATKEDLFADSAFLESVRENYTHTVLQELTSLNQGVINGTEVLYKSLLEAADKKEENRIFEIYFSEFENSMNKTIMNVNEMVSRFLIKINNVADANIDLLEDSSFISTCPNFTFKKYCFRNLDNGGIPKLDTVSIYRSEFDKIGKLMQNLGGVATNQAKLEVIATVYNDLAEQLTTDWVANCMKQISDSCGCPINTECNFADSLYLAFRSKDATDTVITKGMLYDIKNSMSQKDKLINSVNETAQNLVSDFQFILNDLSNILFGTRDGKLVINTPTDGIRNTSYSIDSYSKNQLHIFLKSKFDQILNMANICLIALSIKMDACLDYFTQCKEIVSYAYNLVNSAPASTEELLDNLEDHLDDIGDLLNDVESALDDLDSEDNYLNDGDDVLPTFTEEDDDSFEENVNHYTNMYANSMEFEDLYRSINYEAFETMLELSNDQLIQELSYSVITEDIDDDPEAGDEKEEYKDDPKKTRQENIKAKYDKLIEEDGPFWKVIHSIMKIFALFFSKCKENISGEDKNKGNVLANGEEVQDETPRIQQVQAWLDSGILDRPIQSAVMDDGKEKWPKLNFELLNTIEIPKLEMPQMMTDGYLDSAENFVRKHPSFQKFITTEETDIKTNIQMLIVDTANGYTDLKEIEPLKSTYVRFILKDYDVLFNAMKVLQSAIDNYGKEADAYRKLVLSKIKRNKDGSYSGNYSSRELSDKNEKLKTAKVDLGNGNEVESYSAATNKTAMKQLKTKEEKPKNESLEVRMHNAFILLEAEKKSIGAKTKEANKKITTTAKDLKEDPKKAAQNMSKDANAAAKEVSAAKNETEASQKIIKQNLEAEKEKAKREQEKQEGEDTAEERAVKELNEIDNALMSYFNGARMVINGKAVAINYTFDWAYKCLRQHYETQYTAIEKEREEAQNAEQQAENNSKSEEKKEEPKKEETKKEEPAKK